MACRTRNKLKLFGFRAYKLSMVDWVTGQLFQACSSKIRSSCRVASMPCPAPQPHLGDQHLEALGGRIPAAGGSEEELSSVLRYLSHERGGRGSREPWRASINVYTSFLFCCVSNDVFVCAAFICYMTENAQTHFHAARHYLLPGQFFMVKII